MWINSSGKASKQSTLLRWKTRIRKSICIILNRNVSKEVLFDKGGEWYSTSWEVRRNELPAAVTNTISVEYAGYQMDDAEYFEMATGTSYYQIELEGNNSPDIDIKVTTDGTILK